MVALSASRRIFGNSSVLRENFLSAWSRTDEIFSTVKSQAMLSTPIAFRHPFIFYVGHLPAFAWNQICRGVLRWNSFSPHLDELFSRGIDPDVDTGQCHAHPEVPPAWPDLMDVLDYRDRVRRAVLRSFDAVLERASSNVLAEKGRVFSMVLEHEAMHQETLLYMIQEAPANMKRRLQSVPQYRFGQEPTGVQIVIPRGEARLGARFDALQFGWDNEFPELRVQVPRFSLDSLPVTNGRFLEFVESGGYEEPEWWSEEDWLWKASAGLNHPNVWQRVESRWLYRTLFDFLPLEQVSSWPVYVSLAEARAFARWRGGRLPTEAEFHRAAYGSSGTQSADANLDFSSWSPAPVNADAYDTNPWGIKNLIGNGWEWTQTSFQAFPGFAPYITSYPEYSTDFFDGKHFVLKGASWATARELVRPSFRNWYQAHYPYVFAKFRCVSDSEGGGL
jgi:gamma-glutamyl hercynylcysteine S-oxide synthase